MNTYVETGQVRYIFRNFPLYSIHPQAAKAAEAAECAGEQGEYWEMHDRLFGGQDQWAGNAAPEQIFGTIADALDLDRAQFDECLQSGKYTAQVQTDYQEGIAAGVTGTPAFRINGSALSGAQPFAAFQQQIEYYLAGGEAPTLEVPADSFRSMGQADAPVIVTEFSDYQCPACATVEAQVIPPFIERYVNTGQVRFVYREFPLPQLHPNAQKASEAAICAGKQGGYWEMHEKLFASQNEWGSSAAPADSFKAYAREFGLDAAAFDGCLDSGEAAVIVKGDMMAGEALGVNATPTFFVNDLQIRGGLPIDIFGQVIDYVAAGGPTPEILPQGEDWHVLGNTQTARAISVAFLDYANQASAAHALQVLPALREEYLDAGQLIYILHPWVEGEDTPSELAAIAAECAGQQDKFWEMFTLLFEKQGDWTEAGDVETVMAGYASSLDLDAGDFAECSASDWALMRARSGKIVGILYNVPSATVFLFSNGEALEGATGFDEFKTILDSMVGQ